MYKTGILYAALTLCILCSGYTLYRLATADNSEPKSPKLGAIVRLTRDGRTFCTGSVISRTLMLTAAHCVLTETLFGMAAVNSDPIDIRPRSNEEVGATAKVVYASSQMDYAVLMGDFSQFDHKKFITDPETLSNIRKHTMKYTTCGYPLGGDLYCNTMSRAEPFNFSWRFEGVLLPGMSGGPTMLEDGTVVAVNSAVEQEFSVVSPIYNILSGIK